MTVQETLMPHQMSPTHVSQEELNGLFVVSEEAYRTVDMNRQIIKDTYHSPGSRLIVAMGECGVVSGLSEQRIRRREGRRLNRLSEITGSLLMQRLNVWKPRSNPDDWHGIETTDPMFAYETVVVAVNRRVPATMEIFYEDQLERYGHLLSAFWLGSRSTDNPELREALIRMAVNYPHIPVGVKNGLDGSINTAVSMIDEINRRRRDIASDATPAFLIYRGGSAYNTPQKVENMIRGVIEDTEGRVVIDTAHGVECAFDPKRSFQKSVIGQLSALAMVERLLIDGYTFMGLLVEASDNKGQTDPNIPFSMAYRRVEQILSHAN